jgi:hypothetical protein
MDLAITQGIAAELAFKYQKYNYEKGLPEPIDLTGGKFSLTIYDPAKMKVEVGMQAVSPAGNNTLAVLSWMQKKKKNFSYSEMKYNRTHRAHLYKK